MKFNELRDLFSSDKYEMIVFICDEVSGCQKSFGKIDNFSRNRDINDYIVNDIRVSDFYREYSGIGVVYMDVYLKKGE